MIDRRVKGRCLSRRELVSAAPLALAACRNAEGAYFGRTDPPRDQRLVYLLDGEPGSLDPALILERQDALIFSLFEGLTSLDPYTGAPVAGLATHFEAAPDRLRYTLWLRGHNQKGIGGNMLNRELMKYAWIDTNWKPEAVRL